MGQRAAVQNRSALIIIVAAEFGIGPRPNSWHPNMPNENGTPCGFQNRNSANDNERVGTLCCPFGCDRSTDTCCNIDPGYRDDYYRDCCPSGTRWHEYFHQCVPPGCHWGGFLRFQDQRQRLRQNLPNATLLESGMIQS